MENQVITIVDEDGVEAQFKFLFSVRKQDTQEEFGFFVEMNTDAPMIGAYKFGEEGELINIETQEDMTFAQMVFNSYMAQRSGGCGGGCRGCSGGSCDSGCDCEGDCCE